MPRIPLTGGAYQSRAIIASSQRCINLYPEVNEDEQAPAPATHFPTPGLTLRGTPPAPGISRCVYRTSDNRLIQVVGGAVYFVDGVYGYHLLGNIPDAQTPVCMKDNGFVILIVNGVVNEGWAIRMSDLAFAPVVDPVFEGGTHVDYLDTFFVLDRPGQNRWYVSFSNVTWENLTQGVPYPNFNPFFYKAFDPLNYASKIGSPDRIVAIICMHRNIWILGTLTGEPWYNSGAADFTFQVLPGVYSEVGCTAPYSVATEELAIYWLAQSRRGKRTVEKWDAGFQQKTISKPGIEAIFATFPTVTDAIGGTFQVLGHSYYILQFPTANRTFACELKTEQWHELAWTGPNGLERHRGQHWCFCYDAVLTADRANGTLYEIDPFNLTDFGGPITRLRTIPHILNDGKRVRIDRVIADTQGGKLDLVSDPNPQIFLRISHDRGGTFSDALPGRFGAEGEYGELPWWPDLGMGRDVVIELSWSAPIDTALNGIFLEASPVQS